MSDLEQRVQKLERQNRKLQFGLVAVVAILLAVPLVGAVMPQEIPDVIVARSFRVVDESGRYFAYMDALGLFYYDENGELRAVMNAGGIIYADENGKVRAAMNALGLFYYDERGELRVRLGKVGLVTPATGAETTYPAAVVLYDAEGNVIWQAPQ